MRARHAGVAQEDSRKAGIEMDESVLTRRQAIRKLTQLRRRVSELEASQHRLENLENELRESEERYKRLTDHSFDAVFVHKAGRIERANPAGATLLGADSPSELVGRTDIDYVCREYEELTRERGDGLVEQGDATRPQEMKIGRLDGDIRDIEVTVAAIDYEGERAAQVVIKDITEHKRLVERIQQSQKLESLGRLAGGIAHDFNNVITAVMSYAQLGASALSGQEGIASTSFREIQKAADRASYLTDQLLAFARPQAFKPQVLSLSDLVINMDSMLRRVISEHIELITESAADLDMVMVDPGQMEQVLLNLAVNSRDAMPGGGTLRITTANATIEGVRPAGHVEVRPGEYVMLVIADNGVGIPDEVKAHLFEPFFTTKNADKGTGLGLSTCQEIVTQCGGYIELESEPGKGTTVRIYLPKADGAARTAPREEQVRGLPKGGETVLLVEDEEMVREATSRVLRKLGYHVITASNGFEALELAVEHTHERIDILLADVVMPVMSGLEVAQRLKASMPWLKILFTSGYPDDALASSGVLASGIELIRKPLTPSVLTHRVREVLDR